MIKLVKLFACCLALIATNAFALPFGSQSALVIDEKSGEILLEKNAKQVVPIASLTKLMTAMVVLDAKQDMSAMISIDKQDVDTIKHTTSRVPVGTMISRKDALQLALISSDNRAAASLARTYPGGKNAFDKAVRTKLRKLKMVDTTIEEPTGLSFRNTSTASDLVKMVSAAAQYPEISRITTNSRNRIKIKGRQVEYRNTNKLVGKKGWNILLSKTGFTNEAGRCVVMKVKAAGKDVIMVLLNAGASSIRSKDAVNVRRFLLDQKLAGMKSTDS